MFLNEMSFNVKCLEKNLWIFPGLCPSGITIYRLQLCAAWWGHGLEHFLFHWIGIDLGRSVCLLYISECKDSLSRYQSPTYLQQPAWSLWETCRTSRTKTFPVICFPTSDLHRDFALEHGALLAGMFRRNLSAHHLNWWLSSYSGTEIMNLQAEKKRSGLFSSHVFQAVYTFKGVNMRCLFCFLSL